ncbi:hypothetical protein VOLCADRAFT_103826 [Volvox carteri f. nagariensis]|uniref:beta-fructofuranosidase n=1 Tax=Volvox carteri f. nagariensis TaxID=3068 RepID=D8TPG6_VOLCA|nr:uncharacterized protein VOLCADRAFT_103826 [Volvox carteri f. nagariensis]EFJ50760.1 hypothetical protein VOLCADRAFT_103826 [Volvox carteri f. nagariensis]|eukprot:XP_002948353.1 hypothetical protein VOLCADRAFT_103826 [Volvox carteri f. nagariensis]
MSPTQPTETAALVRQDRPSFHIAPQQGWMNGDYVQACLSPVTKYSHETVSADLSKSSLVQVLPTYSQGLHLAVRPGLGPLCFTRPCQLGASTTRNRMHTWKFRCRWLLQRLRNARRERRSDYPIYDPKLTYWTKIEYPWLSLPPPSNGLERLAGWRDPAIISRPGDEGSDCWTMIIGSGVKDSGGSVLVYTSKELLDGWQFHGELCHGRGNGADTGFMWECPILFKLSTLPRNASLFGSGGQPDACTNPSYYWLGPYDPVSRRFDLATSQGPYRLDLGNVLYAPNILHDTAKGRTLLWGWGQEQRNKVDVYDYAGCLTLPRVMWLQYCADPSTDSSTDSAVCSLALHQQPLPELAELRHPLRSWRLQDALPLGVMDLIVDGGAKMPVPTVSGPFLDLELVFQPAADCNADEPRCSASGLLLQSWSSGPEGSAALIYNWDTGILEVVYEAIDPATLTFSLAAPGVRRVGGRLQRPPAPGSPLSLRVFLDYSCLEVFTGEGEVLTARVYRGSAPTNPGYPAGSSSGIDFISADGPTRLIHFAAYEMQPAFQSGISSEDEATASVPLPYESLLEGVERLEMAGAAGGAA